MKVIGRMVLVLALISAVSALGLAWVENLTRERILEEIRKDTLEAIEAVLPPFDNEPDREMVEIGGVRYYPGRHAGEWVGLALPVRSEEGYGGAISALLGVSPEGKVTGVRILAHAETPGLGAKCTDGEYLRQFVGKTLGGARWGVKKDGGDFDQITGATITPRALIKALEGGLSAQQRDQEAVLDTLRRPSSGPAGRGRDDG